MNFFKSLFQSLHDFKWLGNQRFNSVSRALGFFTLVVLIVTAVQTAPVIFFAFPKMVDEGVDTLIAEVPDFNAVLENNELKIEKLKQPFVFEETSETGEKFKIYIDTVSTSTPNVTDLKDEKTEMIFLVNRQEFQFYDGNQNKTEIHEFSSLENGAEKMEISKADVQGVAEKIQSMFMPWIAGAMFLFALIAVWVVKFIAVLFWALIFKWVASSMGRNWEYGQVLKIVLYAIALPMIVSAVLTWFGVRVPLLYTLLLAVVMYMVIKSDEIGPVTPVVASTPNEPPQA